MNKGKSRDALSALPRGGAGHSSSPACLFKGVRLILVAVLVAVTILFIPVTPARVPVAHAANITVTTTSDTLDAAGGVCSSMTPANITSTGDGLVSLREAICAANYNPFEDTIYLGPYTYNLTRTGAGEDLNVSGDLDITPGGNLNIVGTGPTVTIINGLGSVVGTDRVLHVNPLGMGSITVKIYDVRIQNGYTGNGGGGIYNHNSALELYDSVIAYNETDYAGGSGDGGGIYNDGGALTLFHSSLFNNTAKASVVGPARGGGLYNTNSGVVNIDGAWNIDGGGIIAYNTVTTVSGAGCSSEGGGIYNDSGTVNITDIHVAYNTATSTGIAIGNGAGIYNDNGGTVNIYDSQFYFNEADNLGGGIFNYSNTVNIYDSSFTANIAYSYGSGGIYNDMASSLNVYRSTISHNMADDVSGTYGWGGGIGNAGTAYLRNCTISHNQASGDGGGINNSGNVTLLNVTITDNSTDIYITESADGGGIFTNAGTVNFKNTIIADNNDWSATTVHPDCSGTLNSQDYNLVEVIIGCIIGGTLTNNIYGMSPLLGPLEDNGGPTRTHALLSGSIAANSGTCTGAPATDQRGWARPDVATGKCDMGAYERVFYFHMPTILLGKKP